MAEGRRRWVRAGGVAFVASGLGLLGACSSSSDELEGSGGASSSSSGLGGADFDAGSTGGALPCEAPDMLIVLDRTTSMYSTPAGAIPPDTPEGHAASKWALAVAAVEGVTASLDTTVRFGLELFPRDPGDGSCVTLAERIAGQLATNPPCEAGELLVPPAADASAAVDGALAVESTTLCDTTPMGLALTVALEALRATRSPGRAQYAVLVSDGRDTCDADAAIAAAKAMASEDARLYVVGFEAIGGTGLDPALLNHLACAGHSAPSPELRCVDDGQGGLLAADPEGSPLYFVAEDGSALRDALAAVAGSVCCNCTR